MRIEDEFGRPFIVEAHDPARELVLALSRKGVDYIVLPCYTLVTGLPPQAPVMEPSSILARGRMEDCLAECFSNG